MHADMSFDGQRLTWSGSGVFKATSGMVGFQMPTNDCVPDAGPTPQGLYKVYVADRGVAKDDGSGTCNLSPAWGVQSIPRGVDAGDCEPYWANWGRNRVRLEPADAETRNACSPRRGGFYLHDSTKGYSHGCIEVEPGFFPVLRARSVGATKGYFLLRVKYAEGRRTNGGTRV
ncbi:hypothetical protein [Denitromonas iodatirespirans]|uniref:L,D-TPase catalytic domain-containing protein n=1 Tax=Denitromonas iodatirespirans TaxID=2795389 RepID=A0A944D5T5_DENI1|nr:hypothetical protein [Denitromonas iodatirespirans]MBT0960464.1 hypothetical protein [Denitromonas iodatirespirans]